MVLASVSASLNTLKSVLETPTLLLRCVEGHFLLPPQLPRCSPTSQQFSFLFLLPHLAPSKNTASITAPWPAWLSARKPCANLTTLSLELPEESQGSG